MRNAFHRSQPRSKHVGPWVPILGRAKFSAHNIISTQSITRSIRPFSKIPFAKQSRTVSRISRCKFGARLRPIGQPGREKSIHDSLSRRCRLFRSLNLDSRPVTGNSARRAGGNSPRRSGLQPELRRGPSRDSVHSFFGSVDGFLPGDGGTRKVHFSGWVGIYMA